MEREDARTPTDGHADDRTRGPNKVGRIAEQSRGLFEDVKSWVELRIELARLELKEELEARRNDAVMGTAIAFLGLLALVFVLAAAALGVGSRLGHPAWGFLAVSGSLLVIAWMLWFFRFGRRRGAHDAKAAKELSAPASRQLPQAGPEPLAAPQEVDDKEHAR